MGNVCSSGQKKRAESVSEKSEESPAYEPSNSHTAKEKNEGLAPLADPEFVQDVQTKAESMTKLTSTEIIKNSVNGKNSNNVGPLLVERSESNASTNLQKASNIQPEAHSIYRKAENVKNLLQGKPLLGRQIQRDKKIVLYMLADNTSDYSVHQQIVYNLHTKITEICHKHGFHFMIANIHESEGLRDMSTLLNIQNWTHNPLEAEGGHEEAANCLSEISRHSINSYLVPILFLGNTLGQPMLPLTIESQDFSFVLNAANEHELLMLEKWYAIDHSYQPLCHRLQTEKLKSPLNVNEQSDELNELLQILLKLFTDDLKDSYLTTVVEQEINHTVLMSEDLSKRCIWVQSGIQNMQLPETATILDKEVYRRVSKIYTKMKCHLSEKNIIRITENINFEEELQYAIEGLMERLVNIISEDYEQRSVIPLNTYGVDRTLLEELYEIGHFSKVLAQNAANFDIMNDVKRYIVDKTKYPLVIYGSSGCGKSVLVSKIMENVTCWKPEAHLVLRYVNFSVYSADLLSVLGSIAHQMSVLAFGYHMKCRHSLQSYAKVIQDILNSSLLFFVIVIDGVSELEQKNILQWLPINLNATSKIILTITQESIEEDSELLRSLLDNGMPQTCFLRMDKYSKTQWQDILDSGGGDYYAANGGLKLPTDWRDLQGKTAFHAKCLWWLAWLGQFQTEINDTNEVIANMFKVLANKFDEDHTNFLLLLIASSEHGISETDCLAIFQKYIASENHLVYRKWAKFCWIMGPLLLHLKNVRIADGVFCAAIKQYLSQDYKKVNQIIHNYYENQPSVYDVSTDFTAFNVEKFKKLPYHHLCMQSEDNKNCIYFTNLEWIMNKVKACGPAFLLHDILTAENLSNLNTNTTSTTTTTSQSFVHINFIKEFLTKFIHELSYDGSQCLTFFKYYIKMALIADGTLAQNDILNGWIEQANQLSTPYLEVCNPNICSEFRYDEEEQVSKLISNDQETETSNSFDVLMNLPHDGCYVAAMSSERDEICIWDVLSCQKIRILVGIPQPTAMCPVANYEAAILCRREIKVINLDEGELKVTLKGVMNQKMPYFGLHDQNHLVCLSRNRMYVNLMNLESGDCVTTFKAGEDRFLNSLLVSGDGRILVCGDETQKPFPLLVWHLTQRKLLYDLRIPHHDFITKLSAITHEGSYVCVVAKELNEPTPNFIVVYDLQSGTLFKKWKPNCNTVSLAISQLKACVIAGLENAKILIWDLVTGNCRSTFIGHTAPVTYLKLDPLGMVLLSRDMEGRDNAIRLWDLTSGKFLASFKPPNKILCCEILPNGTHIVLALKNCPNILVLALKNSFDTPSPQNNYTYGKKEHYGKTFQLNLS